MARRISTGCLMTEKSAFGFGWPAARLADFGSLTVKQATVRRGSMMNAPIRTPHPKPTSAKRFFRAIGQITPPIDEPDTVKPIANPRCWTKYLGITENAG